MRGDLERFHAAVAGAGGESKGKVVKFPAGAETDWIFGVVREAQVQLRGLKLLRRTLEDVFLDAVEGRDAR